MELPERLDASWVDALPDAELLNVESELHDAFIVIETEERRLHGDDYQLARGSAELMLAWRRWSMASLATRARGLHARYRPPARRQKH